MNAPTHRWPAGFGERVLVALGLAVLGAVASWLLGGPYSRDAATFVPMLLATAYSAWLLIRSHAAPGKLLVASVWMVLLVGMLAFDLRAPSTMLLLLGMTWWVRAAYWHRKVLAALLDAAVVGMSFVGGMWAYTQTDSVLLGVWMMFLLMAIFVRVPGVSWQRTTNRWVRDASTPGCAEGRIHDSAMRFDTAYRAAQVAAQRAANPPG